MIEYNNKRYFIDVIEAKAGGRGVRGGDGLRGGFRGAVGLRGTGL
jgi:hypothetical protein